MTRRSVSRVVVIMTCVWCLTAPRGETVGQVPELVIQTGHAGSIFSVAFSPDGRLLASGSMDNTIKLWDVASGGQIRSLPGGAISLAFNADGTLLAGAGTDMKIRLWDVASGTVRRTLADGVVSVAFSPDKRLLAGASANTVKLWDVASGTLLNTLTGHTAKVISVAFSPDGRVLASGSYDQTVKLWDVASRLQVKSLAHPGDVIATAFSPDRRLLASVTSKVVKLWDATNWTELKSLENTPGWVNTIAFSPDSKLLASASIIRKPLSGVRLWDVASGTHVDLVEDSPDLLTSLAFSPDGKHLATGSMGVELKLWDVTRKSQPRALKRQSSSVSSIAFSPNGKLLASGSLGEEIKLWDMTSGDQFKKLEYPSLNTLPNAPPNTPSLEHLKKLEGLLRMMSGIVGSSGPGNPIAFSADGKQLASTLLATQIQLWDVVSGRRLKSFAGTHGFITSLAFSPDGRVLASGDTENTVRLWDVTKGTLLKSLGKHEGFVTAVAFSPDGRVLASSGHDKQINLWDVANGTQLQPLKVTSGWITSLAFSPDGKLLAGGGGGGVLVNISNNEVNVWDVASGVLLAALAGHTRTVNSVAFSPDGRVLASGSSDETVRLWDVTSKAQIKSLAGHSDHVTTVAFSADARRLVSSGNDGMIKVWSADTSTPLASLISLGEKDWLVVTPDNLFDGSAAAWRRSIWRFSNNTFEYAPVEAFFSDFYHPGLLAEIMSGKVPRAERNISKKDIRQPQVKIVRADRPTTPDAEVTMPTVAVQVEVTESPADAGKNLLAGGVRDVRLFRNGALVQVWRGDALAPGRRDGCRRQGPGRVACDAKVSIIAGENRLTAYAFNRDNVKSNDGELAVRGADVLKRGGTLYVLAVGINSYANPSYDLRYAVADAQDFGRELKTQQDKLGLYAETQVISLTNREASKANLLLALKRLAEGDAMRLPPGAPQSLRRIKQSQPEDAVVIYFAGHGTANKDRFYLIPHDLGVTNRVSALNRRSLNVLHSHSISDLELEAALVRVDAGQLLMVIDACNSGQALEAEERRRGPMNSKGLAQLAYEKGMYILTAAQSHQAALEVSRLGHGLLTYSLLEGLSELKADADQNREVWDREWMDYATERVPQLQMQEMEQRGAEIMFVHGDDPNTPAGKKNVQRPRVFYRREASPRPFIIARP